MKKLYAIIDIIRDKSAEISKKEKTMKKLISVIMVVCMLLTFAACKKTGSDAAVENAQQSTALPQQEQQKPSDVQNDSSYESDPMPGWDNSDDQEQAGTPLSVSVGDVITFGTYEQDGNLMNGKEAIEWIVLEEDGSSALLISKYLLDNQPYHSIMYDSSWENCSLRKWLNNTFFNDAFSTDEQDKILYSTVTLNDHDRQSSDTVSDKLYILSAYETDRYFSSDRERRCNPTSYALSHGAHGFVGSSSCTYWLRSFGSNNMSPVVLADGMIDYDGNGIATENGIRPVLRVNLLNFVTVSQATEPAHESNDKYHIGDSIVLGKYEQDNDGSSGKESIEWIVLDTDGDKLLVISRYALDSQKYNREYKNVTWETCSLRNWLNTSFLNNAFSAEEQAMIQYTTVEADENPFYNTPAGNDTIDQVFLLSYSEVCKYFANDEQRICVPSLYTKMNLGAYGTQRIGGRDTCAWLVRTPGSSPTHIAAVNFDGTIRENYGVVDAHYAVRPAMWITLDSQEAANSNPIGGNTNDPSSTTPPATANTATVGDLSFDSVTLDGTPIRAGIIRDYDLVMVNFWAEWCGPCVNELPALERIHQEYPNVLVLGVLTWSDNVDGAKETLRDAGVTYPSIELSGSFASFAEQFDGIPDTMFFDRNGRQVSSTVEGSQSYSEWKSLVDSLLYGTSVTQQGGPGASSEQEPDDQFILALSMAKKAGRHSVIAAGYHFVVGVKADGTCISSGSDIPNTAAWTDVVAVSSNGYDVAGLRSDGRVLCTDTGLDVSGWKNIIQIDYNAEAWVDDGGQHLIGLTSDGTVVAAGTNQYGECDTSGWNNIVDIAAGFSHTVGLRADGTVVACGDNQYGQCNVTEWNDIVDVAAARYATYGLTADGEILIAGHYNDTFRSNFNCVPEVPHWDGVVAIVAGNETGSGQDFVVGICRDGSIKTNRSGYLQDGEIESFTDVQAVAVSSWGYTVCVDSRGVAKDVGWDVDGARQVSNWPQLLH